MDRICKFAAVASVVMLVEAVLYAVNLYGHMLDFSVPVHMFGFSHAILYLNLRKILSMIRRIIFAVFFAALYSTNTSDSPVRTPTLVGFLVCVLSVVQTLQWWHFLPGEILMAWVFVLGFGFANVKLSLCFRDKLLRGIAIAFFSLEFISLTSERILYTHRYELFIIFFGPIGGSAQIVLFALFEAAFLYAFSRLRSR